MPLSRFQSRVLRLLAGHRNPESYVAGASPLAHGGARYSSDIDVFHDRAAAMQDALRQDTARLVEEGFALKWVRQFPTLCTVDVTAGDEGTSLEWAVDSSYRFFPALEDALFGYVLHPADIATNKALAAAGRREPRDIVDLLDIHERYLPLGAVLWAACAKDPGFSPEGLAAEIRRNGRYQQTEYDLLRMEVPVDAGVVGRALKAALNEADEFARSMPGGIEGVLFLDGEGRPVLPDSRELDRYVMHGGQQRGHWPSSPEISRAMMERYQLR